MMVALVRRRGHRHGIGQLLAKRLPTVHLSHGDLARRHQRLEQYGGGFGGRQRRLRLDPALELLLYPGPFRQELIAFSLLA